MIQKKIVRLEMFDKLGVKQSFKTHSNSQSESNRAVVGRVGAATLLRNRLNKCMLPRRINAGNKNEVKDTTTNRRQFISRLIVVMSAPHLTPVMFVLSGMRNNVGYSRNIMLRYSKEGKRGRAKLSDNYYSLFFFF